MSRCKVPVYLCNPDTLEIVHRCTSIVSAAHLCGVSRQAVHEAMKLGHLVKGFLVTTPKSYPEYLP